MVLWFTGLSGSGKSTLAHAVEEQLHQQGCKTFVLDGDNVRHGLSREAALAALTRNPAIQCDVEDNAGSLRQGCSADFAVYSADPLDLTSRLTAVYVGGAPIDLEGDDQ